MNHSIIEKMRADLATFQAGQLPLAQLSAAFRIHFAEVADQLPSPFTTVLHDVLDRLEASGLFSEESCSFSQKDLVTHLHTWLDKAQTRLASQMPK